MLQYAYTLIYILLNGLSVLIIHLVGKNIPIDMMITLSSLYALVFFHAVNIKGLKTLYRKVYKNLKLYLITISVFLVMWLVCFIIPVYYTPAILMFYATSWPSFFGAWKKYKKSGNFVDKYMAIFIACVITVFYFFLSKIYHGAEYLILVIGTIIAGISMFMYSNLSFDMNNAGFSPSEILAVRFILLFILPLLWSINSGSIYQVDFEIIGFSLIVSVSSLIIPIYCSQMSILKVGPINHSIAMGITPFVAFIFEYLYLSDDRAVSLDGYFSFALMLIIIIFSAINKYKM